MFGGKNGKKSIIELEEHAVEYLYGQVSEIVENARSTAFKQVNLLQIVTNLLVGKRIVEDEQQGNIRAKYGKSVLKFGDRISRTNFERLENSKSELMIRILGKEEFPFKLTWTHYLILMRIDNIDERNFYEIEAYSEGWNCRTLQRQYGSSLYERLALSRNKEAVLQLAKKGNVVEKPEDLLKQPAF